MKSHVAFSPRRAGLLATALTAAVLAGCASSKLPPAPTLAATETYNYLIAMDHNNLRNMARFVGDDPEHKVSLLMDHTRRPGDVADPWYTGDFEATWQDVLEGCTALLEELR